MKRELTQEEIQYFKEDGYTSDEIKRGFGLFQSYFMNGAIHIERYDEMEMYDGDSDAAEEAEKTFGIKLIHDIPFDSIPDYEFAYYVDTEDNVDIIKNHLKVVYNIDWRS